MPLNDGRNMSVSSSIAEEGVIEPMSIAGRYTELNGARQPVLERARVAAGLTIPSIFPHNGALETDELPTPYQSVGSRTVNNLANKLLLTLFPVSSPFFKLEVPESTLVKIRQEENAESIKNDVESKLSEIEHVIQSDMEINAFRTYIFEAIRALIVSGNFLMHIPATGSPVGYRMDQYVCKRSVRGELLELILREHISKEELTEAWEKQLKDADKYLMSAEGGDTGQTAKPDKFEMYTRVYLDGDKYKEAKYIHGIMLEGTEASYPKDSSAWLCLRWNGLSGEDYGRGYVDEYLGDFRALEGLTRAILEHSAITSKTFGVIRPNSMMQPADLANVNNGGFVIGDAEDLVFPEIGKYNDMRVAETTVAKLTESLSRAFLLTQTRDAERVTAEEVRLQASELETALGGAYSLLAVTFQRPILLREIDRLKKSNDIDRINNKDIEPKVIVGLEGLGRGTDLDKFLRATAAMSQIAPTAQVMPDLDMNKVTQFVFNAVGLNGGDVLKSEATKAADAKAQQDQMQQESRMRMAESAVQQGVKPMIDNAVENPEATMNVVEGVQGSLAAQQQQQQ